MYVGDFNGNLLNVHSHTCASFVAGTVGYSESDIVGAGRIISMGERERL